MDQKDDDNRASVESVVLLPCPFCGETPHGLITLDWRWVGCGNENCVTSKQFGSERAAAEAWNIRKSMDEIESFVDRQIEEMDESGDWSGHAVNALLVLQCHIDQKLRSCGAEGQ